MQITQYIRNCKIVFAEANVWKALLYVFEMYSNLFTPFTKKKHHLLAERE